MRNTAMALLFCLISSIAHAQQELPEVIDLITIIQNAFFSENTPRIIHYEIYIRTRTHDHKSISIILYILFFFG